MKTVTIFLSGLFIAFIGYLFVTGNIALAIIITMGSLIFVPLVVMAINSKLNFQSVSHDATTLHSSGATSGGVGSSGDGGC